MFFERFWKPRKLFKRKYFLDAGTFAERQRSKIKNPYRLVRRLRDLRKEKLGK
jgi:hypothetical protein